MEYVVLTVLGHLGTIGVMAARLGFVHAAIVTFAAGSGPYSISPGLEGRSGRVNVCIDSPAGKVGAGENPTSRTTAEPQARCRQDAASVTGATADADGAARPSPAAPT
ncbi:hypothetical protein [Tropicimonas sp. IMCC34043]|uniref:hypothetical protein n=1 Tax=Tropicimonas sp. IMCC34043 TaxID=2248760 RepID=UPI0013009519|nr:hypothetical protein [Tropicimonas sp. IMCC34043]